MHQSWSRIITAGDEADPDDEGQEPGGYGRFSLEVDRCGGTGIEYEIVLGTVSKGRIR